MKNALIALSVLFVAATIASATPTVTLTATTTGTLWQVWATVSSDCAGLASFDISFGGAGGGTITSSTQKAYRISDPDSDYIGFNSSFKSNGTVSAGAVADIINGQPTAYGDTPDAGKNAMVISGCGQLAKSVYNQAGDTVIGSIAVPFLVAQGQISGTLPLQAGNAFGNVLTGTSNSWLGGPGNASGANFVFGSGFTPEPASMCLLVAGGLALLRRKHA
jgi:hypothetical protein